MRKLFSKTMLVCVFAICFAFCAYGAEKASVDTSSLSKGLVGVKYTGGSGKGIVVQIAKSGSTVYTYQLNNAGNTETFALTDGDGTYSIKVFENTAGTKYAQVFSKDVTMKLDNEFAPFLSPNQYVNYTSGANVVKKAAEITRGETDELKKVQIIYNFAVDNISYDYDKAKTVKSGYLPNPDETLSTCKGICFDYAAVMASMLRSQKIPTKLVIGYAGETYHAWINVYITGTGWVDSIIYFDGTKWTLMDPTFASTGKKNQAVQEFIANPENYKQMYAY